MSNVYDIKVEQGSGTNFKEGIMVFTTSDGDSNVTMSSANVYEGTSNLFYTDDRVQDSPAVDNLQTQIDNLEAGTSGHIVESTGIFTGGVLGTGGLTSQYSITDGTGQVVDSSGNTIYVSWIGKTNITPTNIGTQIRTYVAIDSSGNVVEQPTPYTNLQTRSLIVLGILVHADLANITIINNRQIIAYNAMSTTHDLAESIGIFNIDGNVFSANGANLSLDKSVGKAFRYGSNYEVDPNNPHEKTLPLLTTLSFNYIFNDNSIAQPAVTVIDPANLDDGAGGLTALTNNTKWSVQRIYSFTSNVVVLQRGVEEFDTKSEAILGINSEDYFIAPSLKPNALLRGWLVVVKTATDLSNTAEAEFIEAPKFGEGGGASGGSVTLVDLQTAYNNSITPEIITDATRGALTVRVNSGANTDNAIEVKNISGTTNYGVDGNGDVTGNTFNGVPLTNGGSVGSYLDETGNYVSIPDYTTAGLVTQVEFNSATTGININLNDLQTQINVINATSGATTTLQTAYDNSTTPEIITDATRGAFTVQNGQALDVENIWDGKNIAGTTTSEIRGDGSASFTGELNVSGNIVVTGTVDGRNISNDGATLDSIQGLTDGDKGDITVSDSGSNWTLDAGVVDSTELANFAVTTGKLAQNTVTLDRMAKYTAGSLISYDGANDPQLIPVGTSGYVLTSNGVGTIPTFQPIGDLGGATNLSIVNRNTSTLDVASDTGTDATVPAVTTSLSGLMTGADKTKLDGIATSANNYTHPNHTGDVTSTGDGATVIVNDAVSNTKLANMVQATIKGRASGAGTGDPVDLTATQVRTILNVENGATADQTLSKTFTLETPTATDDITIFRTDVAITVVEVIAVSTGTTPNTTYQLKHGTNRNLAGTALTTSASTTSITTGDIATLSGGGSVLADSWIWLETTVASGTGVTLSIDIRYTED